MIIKSLFLRVLIYGILGFVLGGITGYLGTIGVFAIVSIFGSLDQGVFLIFITIPIGAILGLINGILFAFETKYWNLGASIGSFVGFLFAVLYTLTGFIPPIWRGGTTLGLLMLLVVMPLVMILLGSLFGFSIAIIGKPAFRIFGMEKQLFLKIVKWGTIAGIASVLLNTIVFPLLELVITSIWNLENKFTYFLSGYILIDLASNLIFQLILGMLFSIILILIVVVFFNKLPFNTFFKKTFALSTTISIMFYLLSLVGMALYTSSFFALISLLTLITVLAKIIIISYIYTKIVMKMWESASPRTKVRGLN